MSPDFHKSVAVSAVAGAVGIGLVTKIAQMEKLATVAKVGLEVAADASVSIGSKAAKGEKVTVAGVALDVAVGQAGGKIAGKIARGKAEASLESKMLDKAATRAERIANNPKVGRSTARQRQAEAARSAQKTFQIEKEVQGAAIGSGSAQKTSDTIEKGINKSD